MMWRTSSWTYWITLGVLTLLPGVATGLYFTLEPDDRVAVLSKPLWWDCSVNDHTDPVTYSWTINQVSLPTSANQVIYSNGTLYIRRLTSDDVGVYVCTATSGGENVASREARLELAYMDLSFGTSPASQTVFLGDTVTLACKITSLPPAVVTWTLDGVNETRGVVSTTAEGESTLTLSPVLYEDAGSYKCIATNTLLSVYRYSLEATLVIQGRPVFSDFLRSVSVPLGFTATFTCHFHGNPMPQVRWLLHKSKPDGSVSTAELQNSEKYQYFANGTLHIFAVTYNDQGFYTCNVENVFGEMSESAQLTVTGEAQEPVFTREPVNTSISVGQSAVFDCRCSGNPDPRLYWTQNETELVSSDRVTLHQNGSLSVLDVQTSDMGWFSCLCENAVGSTSQSAFLDVQVSPSVSVRPPLSVVEKGEAVMLHCDTEGNPTPQLAWKTPYSVIISRTQLVPGYTIFQNGSLEIQAAALEDAGIHTCIATNRIGSMNQSLTVMVEVPPEFTTLPVSQSVNVGGQAFLHCQATGIPRPSYTWAKDGEGIINSTPQRQIYLNNTLALHSIRREDAGVYRCTAVNVRGQVSSVATLSVLEPPYFSVEPSSQKVKVGDTVQLRCIAVGYPVPTQRWIKDGRQLVLEDNMVSLPDGSQLTIVGIREAQFGRFDCLATSVAGTVSSTAWIKTQDLPVITVIPQNRTANLSDTLVMACYGQADEAPSIQWYKGRSGENTLVQDSDRVTVSEAGDLSFMSVWASDEGWYTCVVYNSVGQVSAEVYIDVQVPPHIVFTNSPQSTMGRFSVTLICQFSGDPTPTLQWYNPLGLAVESSSAHIVSGNTLEIKAANGGEDAGRWTCEACNLLGCDTETVKVIIEGIPTIESFTGSKSGDLVTLTCEVSGEPTPAMTFSSEGQQVTIATEGHTQMSDGSLVIEEKYVKPQYSCSSVNKNGKVIKTLTVPGQMAAPTVTNIQSEWVTLRWPAPAVGLDALPLIGYIVQRTSNYGTTWQSTAAKPGDLLTSRYLNISLLDPYTEYSFRVSASNILGRGRYSEPSGTVRTLPGAPSPPSNVVTLETADGTYLLVWNHPSSLNGPSEDIVYQYKLAKMEYDDTKGHNSMMVHSQGTIAYNQSREMEIDVSEVPGHYIVTLSAVNTRLNMSSSPVKVEIDTTPSGAEKHTGDTNTTKPDKIIAIVFGVVGGVVAVCLIIFIVKHVRTQRKSESISLVHPRLPLDQFYMEDPKDLYRTESRLSIKRRSGHSFYSFQEDDSFHGSRSMLKDTGSVPRKRGKSENDVLLVARNPLYNEPESKKTLPVISSRETTPEHEVTKSIEESYGQTEITLPVSEVMEIPSHKSSRTGSDVTTSENDKNSSNTTQTKEPITPLSAKDLEEDIMKIYSSMNGDNHSSSSHQPELPQEHIYSSIHSDTQSSRSKGSSSYGSNFSNQQENNFIIQKPPVKNRPVNHNISTNGGVSDTTGTSSPIKLHKSKSSSPPVGHKHYQNGDNISSNAPKPPTRVISLDALRPNTEIKDRGNLPEDSVPLVHRKHYVKEVRRDSEGSGDESSDTDTLIAIMGGNSMDRARPLDMRLEDNLLSEEEYHRDVVLADLY